jgi:hypothetical protein
MRVDGDAAMSIEDLLVDGSSLLVLTACFIYAHRMQSRQAVPARVRADRLPGARITAP